MFFYTDMLRNLPIRCFHIDLKSASDRCFSFDFGSNILYVFPLFFSRQLSEKWMMLSKRSLSWSRSKLLWRFPRWNAHQQTRKLLSLFLPQVLWFHALKRAQNAKCILLDSGYHSSVWMITRMGIGFKIAKITTARILQLCKRKKISVN